MTRNDRDRARRLELIEKHVVRVEKALAIDDRLDGKVKGVLSIVSNKGLKKFVKRLKSDRGRYRLNKRIREERRVAGLAAICATNLERRPEDVIADYRSLWKTEASFRDFKGPIALRPMYHRASRRIRAHVLLCTIAVNVMRYLEKKLDRKFPDIKKAWATSTAGRERSAAPHAGPLEGRAPSLAAGADRRRHEPRRDRPLPPGPSGKPP